MPIAPADSTDPMEANLKALTDRITTIVTDDPAVSGLCHSIAAAMVGEPSQTVFGGNHEDMVECARKGVRVITEDDPRYAEYWNYYSLTQITAISRAAGAMFYPTKRSDTE
jgi:hypothetical protein